MGYIIGGIILGILGGILNGLYLVYKIEPTKKIYSILIMVITIIVMSGIFVLFALSMRNNSVKFNNGYCIECDTKYEAITHRNGRTYYECPNCYYGIWH